MIKRFICILIFSLAILCLFTACSKDSVHTHTFGEWRVVSNPTASEDGMKERTCSCGETDREVLLATGSLGLEYQIESDTTCTLVGIGSCTDEKIYIPSVYENKMVTAIGERVFYDCDFIKEVTIPTTVESIGSQFLYKADSVETIFQNSGCSVSFVGDSAKTVKTIYYNGTKAKLDHNSSIVPNVIIGNNVTELDFVDRGIAFKELDIKNLSNWLNFSFSILYSHYNDVTAENPMCCAESVKINGETVTELVIPEGITKIGTGTFAGFKEIETLVLPSTLVEIHNSAFLNCENLSKVNIPKSLKIIDYYAFENCLFDTIEVEDIESWLSIDSYLSTDELHTNVTRYLPISQNGLTVNGESIDRIEISDKIKKIPPAAFYGCKELANITIQDSVVTIGYSAFQGCTSLKTVVVPDSVTTIEGYAFSECTSLSVIEIPDSVTFVGGYAFSGCTSLTSFTIPDSVSEIYAGMFKDCIRLSTVVIPDTVEDIRQYAFQNCTSLTEFKLPNNLRTLPLNIFSGCTSLTTITLPENLKYVNAYDFSGCTSLTTIKYPGTEEELSEVARFNDGRVLYDYTIIYNYSE